MEDGKRVALRKESVDRNLPSLVGLAGAIVALRKESVDRNISLIDHVITPLSVALRKESVDRNSIRNRSICARAWSLSARRAWIEILA